MASGAADRDRALGHAGQCRNRHVSTPVEGVVLVDLVGDDDQVVLDRLVGDRIELLDLEDLEDYAEHRQFVDSHAIR
jgi:hypothetical protein